MPTHLAGFNLQYTTHSSNNGNFWEMDDLPNGLHLTGYTFNTNEFHPAGYFADRAIQFHGAFGFTYDCDAALYRRQAIFKNALIGDAHWHRAKLAPLLFD